MGLSFFLVLVKSFSITVSLQCRGKSPRLVLMYERRKSETGVNSSGVNRVTPVHAFLSVSTLFNVCTLVQHCITGIFFGLLYVFAI
jgi:hypothetical protein